MAVTRGHTRGGIVLGALVLTGCGALWVTPEQTALPAPAPVAVADAPRLQTQFGVRVYRPGSDVAELTAADRHVLEPFDPYGLTVVSAATRNFIQVAQARTREGSSSVIADGVEGDETYRAWTAYCNNAAGPNGQPMTRRQWVLIEGSLLPASLAEECVVPK